MTLAPRSAGQTPAGSAAGTWFRVHRAADEARLRLICFPHAGGNAQFFHGWRALLPQDVELLAVRYPGRQDRFTEPCFERMDALADAIVGALEPYLDRPLAFFGHSMGSSVAYEVALRLEQRGIVPQRLLVSARAAPHRAKHTALHQSDDETLIAEVRRLGNLDAEAYDIPELRELLLPVLRADYRLLENHRPQHPRRVRAPITAYTGDDDPHCGVEDARTWSELTAPGAFDVRSFPGDHFYLVPRERELLADLSDRLR
ncbi:thioesterase II family protein [Streptomyces sp. NPDC053427]|uniref:thioesterase II family protein n=1 Tax=Streptomyces sp. NPDC053427 TaxID=3365701 RepID=UPI0037D19B46